jgi:hypothetical protein
MYHWVHLHILRFSTKHHVPTTNYWQSFVKKGENELDKNQHK